MSTFVVHWVCNVTAESLRRHNLHLEIEKWQRRSFASKKYGVLVCRLATKKHIPRAIWVSKTCNPLAFHFTQWLSICTLCFCNSTTNNRLLNMLYITVLWLKEPHDLQSTARDESIKHISWQHIKLSYKRFHPVKTRIDYCECSTFGNSAQVFLDLFLCCQVITNWESEQFPSLTLSQTQTPDNTHASAQLQRSGRTANIHGVHKSLKNENARGWNSFNHSEGFSRWPPK